MEELTAAQARLLDAIQKRIARGDVPPSYRELCKEFGWASTGTARDHLRALQRKGYVSLPDARGKRVSLRIPVPRITNVPILGGIRAGSPASAEQIGDEMLPVPASWIGPGNHFALRVRGISMINAGILEGDYVILRQQREASTGDIVAVTLEGETTLKRFEKRGRRVFLIAENSAFQPIEIRNDGSLIHGVVIGLLRKYEKATKGGDTRC